MTVVGKMSWEDAVRRLLEQPDQAAPAQAAYFDLPLACSAAPYPRSEEYSPLKSLIPGRSGRAPALAAAHVILSYALASDGWMLTAV